MSSRDLRVDSVRGLLLVIMTINHLGGEVTAFTSQPLGFVSAAEGFVLLSAFSYAVISLGGGSLQHKPPTFSFDRIFKIYKYHAVLLLALCVIAATSSVYNDYWQSSLLSGRGVLRTLAGGLTLVHQPRFFDILPMYMIFSSASHWILNAFRHERAIAVFTISFALWLAGQFYNPYFALTQFLGDGDRPGPFNLLSWQILWVFGMYAGFAYRRGALRDFVCERLVLLPAIAISLVFFIARHNLIVFDTNLAGYFDKSSLSIYRLVNIFSLVIVLMAILQNTFRDRGLPFLRFIGKHSLPVFSYHIFIIYLLQPIGWRFETHFGAAGQAFLYISVVLSLMIPAALHERYLNNRRLARGSALAPIAHK